MRRAAVLLVVAMGTAGGVSATLVPRMQAAGVPENLREGRWETSIEGRQVRDLVESLCGPLPVGAWLVRAGPVHLPELRDAPDELLACFQGVALPAMSGGP